MKKIILSVIILLTLFIVMGCGVSKEKYNSSLEQYNTQNTSSTNETFVTISTPATPIVTSSSPSPLPSSLQSIAITPASPQPLSVGSMQNFKATGQYLDGSTKDITSQVTWASSNESVASIYVNNVAKITSSGLVLGLSAGTTNITATLSNITSLAINLTVVNSLKYIELIYPNSSNTFQLNVSFQFNVIGTYADGTSENLTSKASFESSNPGVIYISPSGVATVLSYGNAEITAWAGGMSTSMRYTFVQTW